MPNNIEGLLMPAPGAEIQVAPPEQAIAVGNWAVQAEAAAAQQALWAPQLGVKPIKKIPIKPVINPNLPKMEFNVEAKKAKTWYRPTTKEQVKEAIDLGYVIAEQMHYADEDDVTYWNPIKFPSVAHIGLNRLACVQIHPDKKYLITYTALYKSQGLGGNSTVAVTLNKRNMKMMTEWQEAIGDRFIKWLGSPKFFVVEKEVLYV